MTSPVDLDAVPQVEPLVALLALLELVVVVQPPKRLLPTFEYRTKYYRRPGEPPIAWSSTEHRGSWAR